MLDDASAFEFPLELWDRGVEGEAVVRLRVTSAGVVDSAAIHESSGEAAFDEAALAGALELRFDPARQGDDPVDAWVRLPVRFTRVGEAGDAEVGSPELTDGDRPQVPASMGGDAAADSSSSTESSETRSGS